MSVIIQEFFKFLTKGISVSAWLSLKSVADLLVAVAADKFLSNLEILKFCGDLYIHILVNTPHNGAVEKTAVLFENFCLLLWKSKEEDILVLIDTYLKVLFSSRV